MARPNNETDQTMLTTAGDETDHVSVPHRFGLERDIFSHPSHGREWRESGEGEDTAYGSRRHRKMVITPHPSSISGGALSHGGTLFWAGRRCD